MAPLRKVTHYDWDGQRWMWEILECGHQGKYMTSISRITFGVQRRRCQTCFTGPAPVAGEEGDG